jgi:hypothetical protein
MPDVRHEESSEMIVIPECIQDFISHSQKREEAASLNSDALVQHFQYREDREK